MSQNREMKDRAGVVRGLEQRSTGDDIEIAESVAHHAKPGP
jgi:predicted FMN-binding regulatory protein PaiB